MMPFNLSDALKEYGENDTKILLHSVLEMRRILLEITSGYDIMLKEVSKYSNYISKITGMHNSWNCNENIPLYVSAEKYIGYCS